MTPQPHWALRYIAIPIFVAFITFAFFGGIGLAFYFEDARWLLLAAVGFVFLMA